MFKHYLLSSIRNLIKYRFFSILNIIGLAIGMAATIMILSWTSFHMSFDQGFENHKNIYRVIQHIPFETDVTWAISEGPLGESLTNEFPEIESSCRILETQIALVPDEVTEYIEPLLFADPFFLDIFGIDCQIKSTGDVLESRDEILLSESLK